MTCYYTLSALKPFQSSGGCPFFDKSGAKISKKGCPFILSKGSCPNLSGIENCPYFKNIGNCTFLKKACPFSDVLS